ncbi:MAG: beta-lactamase family protein [Candidatus Solibacter usitatus]|nr:beta-lactamase family protein [Candidatus Solibacter usitatus]
MSGLAVFFLLSFCSAAPPDAAPKAGMDAAQLSRIPARMKEYINAGALPGIVTLVQRKGEMVHLEATGWQDKEKDVALKTDTIFEVMSMTKPVTAVGIQMLVEDGLIALNDPVEKYLPEFRGQMRISSKEKDQLVLRRPSRPITIRDLLTHTSGMPEYPPEGMGGVNFYYAMNRTLAEAVSIFSQLPLEFEPGTKWSYSNTGIAALGRIIEAVSGKPYETFLADRVFAPLAMKDSFFFPPKEKVDRIASVYEMKDGKLQNVGPGILRKGAKYSMPEGGLYATARDMAAFYQMMLNGGAYNGKRLLSKYSVEAMTTVHTAGTGVNWGLGWSVTRGANSTLTLLSEGTFSHGGAFGTYGWVDPVRQVIGVFMTQRLGGGGEEARGRFVEMTNAAVLN